MGEPVSVRQFAKLDGCSHTLVQKAIREGKLAVSDDGRLDPALAGTGWRKQNRRGNPGGNTTKVATAVATRPKRARSAPDPALDARIGFSDDLSDGEIAVSSEEAIDFIAEVLAGRFLLTGAAERVKENALAAKNLLAAQRAAGDVVDIEVAEAVLFEQARQYRDAWLGWPSRVGPLIAADLNVSADAVVEALNKHVQQQLHDLGEPDPEFEEGED